MLTIVDVASAAIALGMAAVVAMPSNAGWSTKLGASVHATALFALVWLSARALIATL